MILAWAARQRSSFKGWYSGSSQNGFMRELILKLNDYQPLRVPLAFEHASGSATHQVFAAMFVDDGLYRSAVFREGG